MITIIALKLIEIWLPSPTFQDWRLLWHMRDRSLKQKPRKKWWMNGDLTWIFIIQCLWRKVSIFILLEEKLLITSSTVFHLVSNYYQTVYSNFPWNQLNYYFNAKFRQFDGKMILFDQHSQKFPWNRLFSNFFSNNVDLTKKMLNLPLKQWLRFDDFSTLWQKNSFFRQIDVIFTHQFHDIFLNVSVKFGFPSQCGNIFVLSKNISQK